MRSGVKYRLADGRIVGTVVVSVNSDLGLNIDLGEDIVEVDLGHPVLGSQVDWECPGGVLTYSPKPRLVRQPEPGPMQYVMVLLDELNELRQARGLNLLSVSDIVVKARLKLGGG